MVLPRAAPQLATRSRADTRDETALVARARAGEIGALDELMNRHRARLLNLAFQITRDRESAEDCAQEAFVLAFSKLNGFRGQSSFGTWLYRIALNVALEKRRQSLTIRTDGNEVGREIGSVGKSDVESGERAEHEVRVQSARALNGEMGPRARARNGEAIEDLPAPPRDLDQKMALEWALDQLSEPLRVALILREWHGLTYDEMASACQVPVGTIRSRLSAARAEFRRVWRAMEADNP